MSGWEWPAPDAPKCGAKAEDRGTRERFACCLAVGHRSQEHHWEEIVRGANIYGRKQDDVLRSASWFATGPVTFIGGGVAA